MIRCLLAVLLLGSAEAADWPQFLGPAREGAAADSERALPDAFASEPKPLWSHSLGSGQAGPVVAEGKVIVWHRLGGAVVIEALEAKSGATVWERRFPTAYRDAFGMDNGPRAVPTVSGGRVFLHGADGKVYALDLATGKENWQVDTEGDQGSPQGYFGRACAPLVVDGKVIITTGGRAAVTAFGVNDGHVLWTGGEDEASYSSPVMSDGKTMLAWLRNNLTTFDVSNGKVLNQVPHRPAIDASVSAATPIKTGSGWFITAEYDVGASLWEVSASDLKQTWTAEDKLNAHYATPVCYEGHVYGFDGRQERGMTLRCLDLRTKRITWESPRVTGGTLLRVKDKLLVLTEGGELWIVKASPEKFDEILTVQILKSGHRSYAAYSDGLYFARDGENLIAVRLSQP